VALKLIKSLPRSIRKLLGLEKDPGEEQQEPVSWEDFPDDALNIGPWIRL